jgi:myo-inositol catabolism protein IolC
VRLFVVLELIPAFIGFAIGRTDFWQPLVDLRDKKISRDAAVDQMARRYREFVDAFEGACAEVGAA